MGEIDYAMKIEGLKRVLQAHPELDIKKAASLSEDMTPDDFVLSIPSSAAEMLAQSLQELIGSSSTIGDFFVNIINTMDSLAYAASYFYCFVKPNELSYLIETHQAYNKADSGSVAEVNSRKNLLELIDNINERAVSINSQLFAAFQDDEIGFTATMAELEPEDYDESEEEDEDSDENLEDSSIH